MRYIKLLNRFQYLCFWINTSSNPITCKLLLQECDKPMKSIMNFNVWNRPNTTSSLITKNYFVMIDSPIIIEPYCDRIFYQSNNKRDIIHWVSKYVFSKEGIKDIFSMLYNMVDSRYIATMHPCSKSIISKILTSLDESYKDDDFVYNHLDLTVHTI